MPVPPPPPARLVVKKGSKMRSRIFSGMPGPVSVTSTRIRPAWSTDVRTVSTFSKVSPFSIACWALTIRLTSTWWSWSLSPETAGRPVPKLTRTAIPEVRSAYSVSSSEEAIRSFMLTSSARASRRRAMARKVWTMRAQRSAAAPILRARSSKVEPRASSCSISAWPTIAASGLLSSWLTPASIAPIAASFSDCIRASRERASSSSARLRPVMSIWMPLSITSAPLSSRSAAPRE